MTAAFTVPASAFDAVVLGTEEGAEMTFAEAVVATAVVKVAVADADVRVLAGLDVVVVVVVINEDVCCFKGVIEVVVVRALVARVLVMMVGVFEVDWLVPGDAVDEATFRVPVAIEVVVLVN